MTVTVLPIYETDFRPEASLAKVMNERLRKLAEELQNEHLRALTMAGEPADDVVVYLSYNPKYTVRWRIVNDVPAQVDEYVSMKCAKMGFIKWKTVVVNIFKGNE
ncbi:hypothetical protein EZJ43_11390 [Pedobacter changchengzhani]|uniref:Uncharacterized protein n=1 Tax=Pedobacter changchengzhani TaxID=2529274 RepID=A0A4R5MJU5_9SPHI|nr:hypothetical protein [Pedobacter changchengzhani]TDG35947.1 hypothetical protein EZJ43_11390 [Pedobacter changchengzhani]